MGAPSTAREALLAELLGDIHTALERMEGLHQDLGKADEAAQRTVAALEAATAQYRAQVDDQMARLRVEFAALLTTTTEHAVRLQTEPLQKAAVLAVRQAVMADLKERHKQDALRLVLICSGLAAAVGSAVALVASKLLQLL